MIDQKQDLYSAENWVSGILEQQHRKPVAVVAGSTVEVPTERKFADLPSIQRYADLICQRFGLTPVVARECRSNARAFYQAGTINIPVTTGRWACREMVVLHELAHHAAQGDGHGPRFAGKFLELVRFALGETAEWMLKIQFWEQGVDFH